MRNIDPKERLIFALDFHNEEIAKDYVKLLKDYVRSFKVGLQLFIKVGNNFIRWLTDQDLTVMLDLKIYDIPETTRLSIIEISKLNVNITTVHTVPQVIKAASIAKGDNLKVVGVTLLTSMNRDDLLIMGINREVGDFVLNQTRLALESGADGIVSSPLEVKYIRSHFGYKPIIITPGVRPQEFTPITDQQRVATPYDAILNGADYIVIGRPIRDANDPVTVTKNVLNEIESALKDMQNAKL